MQDEQLQFDMFWEASSLDKFNVQKFSQNLNSYDSDDKELFLEYAYAATTLPLPKNPVNKIAKKRKSDRAFSNDRLSVKELGNVLSSFYSWNGLEHRGYPSAGATYATEIYCIAFNVELYSGKILYYDSEKHGVIVVAEDAPLWNEASESLNIETTGIPAMLIIFVSLPGRAIQKYGERGGRFALIEAGAALQQLSLQIAESSKLKGVTVGGMLDSVWKQKLKLEQTNARITVGYLLGK